MAFLFHLISMQVVNIVQKRNSRQREICECSFPLVPQGLQPKEVQCRIGIHKNMWMKGF